MFKPVCAFLQWSTGPRYLFGLGHDHRHHQLLHLHDVWVTVHQSHARPHAAGTKSRLYSWMRAGIDWRDAVLLDCCVSDWGVCVCDFYEHRTQSEDNGRRTLLHPNSCHQRLWRGHGHFHLSCKSYYPVDRHALSIGHLCSPNQLPPPCCGSPTGEPHLSLLAAFWCPSWVWSSTADDAALSPPTQDL